ncbi:MAG: pilin, partial [Gemmatimonadaceae bacterium]|nr:pilin [Gemmatimonadaceae bacterium]
MTCANDANCTTYGAGYTCDQEQSVCIFTPPQTSEISGREVPGPSLQIPIPGILTNFSPAPLLGEPGERYFYFPWIGQYIAAVYQYILGIVGILATVVIVWAGVLWLTAAGNAEKIKLAKEYIAGALIGLVLAFGSYL